MILFHKYRRYMHVAKNAAGVAKGLTYVWDNTRKCQYFTLDLYKRLVIIAQKRGVEIPKPKVNMLAE